MMFEPLYFLGWMVQPVNFSGRCIAYERVDTNHPAYLTFESPQEACRYIRKKVGK